LTQGFWSLTSFSCGDPGSSGTWTYSNGTVHVIIGQLDAQLSVARGGRVMTTAFNNPPSGRPVVGYAHHDPDQDSTVKLPERECVRARRM
jgi:hypothetical protein